VRIALVEKGLAYTVREVDLANKPAELFALNPAGAVPVLVDGGAAVPESLVILQYLEDRFPAPPLLPADALGRARARLLCDRITAQLGKPSFKVARGSPEEKAVAADAVRSALSALEREVPEEGFLVGPFSFADIVLAPFVARLPPELRPSRLGLPRLARWERAAWARPAVATQTAASRPGATPASPR
jgi:glutathione S-transferase